MKWKAKNDTCGVPGKGYIKAEHYSQEDEDNLLARAKSRGIDPNIFMLGAGFVPSGEAQLEIPMNESPVVSEDLKVQYKALYGRFPRSDWDEETVKAKIDEKK